MQITVQSSKQNLGIESAPHIKDSMTTQKIMFIVLLTLIPVFAVNTYFFGFGAIIQFIIAAIFCETTEAFCLFLRKKKVLNYLKDCSALVTAALLALTLPPLMPWYLTASASIFAMVIVKHAFGGLGMNIFNPAMAGFIFLVVSAPSNFYNAWINPAPALYKVVTISEISNIVFNNENKDDLIVSINQYQNKITNDTDAISSATILEKVKTKRKAGNNENIEAIDFLSDNYIGYIFLAASIVLAYLVLSYFKIIMFEMPLIFIASLAVFATIWHQADPTISMGICEHLLTGGTILAAVFIITDPVTNAGTVRGRIVFAFLTAFLVILIRIYGSYSDSVAFAVLLANACAPLIDVLTKRRPFGIGYQKGGLK